MKKAVKKNNVVPIAQKKWKIEYDIPLPEKTRKTSVYYPIEELNKRQASFWHMADANTKESAEKLAKKIYSWYRQRRVKKNEFQNIYITGAAEAIKGQWGARIWRTND